MAVTRIKNNQITDSTIVASAKVQDYSITATKIANNLTYGSNLTVTGNLTVQGNTTAIDTIDLVVEDPVIILASNQTGSPALDIGYIGERGTSQNIAFVWDESASEFVTVYTNDVSTNTTVNIASYANFHTKDANIGGNIVINGTTSFVGNIISTVNVTGNVAVGNIATNGVVTALGNITGGNLTTAGTANIGTLAVTGAATVGTTLGVTGNATVGNLGTLGAVTATGNITGGNLIANTALSAPSLTVSGNITGGNLLTGGLINAAGNITGGNLIANSAINAGTTITATGNITGGNLTTAGTANIGTLAVTGTSSHTGNATFGNIGGTGLATFTGNITGGNLIANSAINAGTTITATGNITGGNLTTAGTANIGTLAVTGAGTVGTTLGVTGNITGGNLTTAGTANIGTLAVTGTSSHTGNATFGNVAGSGLATFTGNITGGNLISNALIYSTTLETTGNALIGGNLIVMGNLTYQNVDDLRVQDPVIIMGTGPNGAPLTTNDSMDRGIFMEYYTTGLGNAFVGWDNSTGNMIAATSVNFSANNIVNVLSYGTFQTGNIYAQTAVATGNITGGNLITAGTVNATGNINGTGAVFTGNVTASTFIGNIKGNIDAAGSNTQVQFNDTGDILGASAGFTFDKVANLLTVTGNVNGGNLVTAGQASVTGNITGGNLNTAGQVIATGNITGGNILTSGNIFDTGPITINTGASGNVNLAPNGSNMLVVTTTGANLAGTFNATGNANVGNLGTAGLIVATGNITGGNLVTAGLASVTGNITGGNLTTAGTANIGTLAVTGAATIGTTLGVTGNANVGNLGTAGLIVATGNITGGNITTAGLANLGNIRISGDNITDTNGRVNFNQALADVDFAVNGTAANIFYVDAGANTVSFGNATQVTNALATFNSTTSIKVPVGTTGERPSTGVTGMVRFNTSLDTLEFYDNDSWTTAGSVFTVIAANTQAGTGSQVAFTLPQAGTTASTIVSINGVVQIPITAYSVTGNVCTFTEAPESTDVIDFRQLTTTSEVAALASASGALLEASQTSIEIDITGNLIPSANVTYDLGSATSRWKDLYLSGTTLYLGNATITATGSGLSSSSGFSTTGNLAVGNIVNSNANGVGNIGSSTNYFNTVFAKATSALYADLAEMYEADADYEPGTVVAFGGTKEVTLCFVENNKRVAGVVSTNPSYLMNSAQTGEFVIPLALQGRVPCKVFGPVEKGDLMVSGSNGRAIVNNNAQPGTIIGKAIENFVGAEGVIEVVVGRF